MTSSSGHEVVAIGTGNKCLGDTKRTPEGDVVRDSVTQALLPCLTCVQHAEVIARRSFMKFLMVQLQDCLANKPSIFMPCDTCKLGESLLRIKDDYKFHLYVSQNLCIGCGSIRINNVRRRCLCLSTRT